MRHHVAVVYNEPEPSRYDATGESKAVLAVLESVVAVQQALTELGWAVTRLPLSPPLEQARQTLRRLDVELVFDLFEGFCGYPETEALVPETLAERGLPCTGCPGAAIRLALDKARVKAVLKAAGIPTPECQRLTPQTADRFRLSYPCIVKPCAEDASHGLTEASVVNDLLSLETQVKAISRSYGGSALVEEFIDGREFNATVLGGSRPSVLPVSEIAYSLPPGIPRILTFAAKWETDSAYFQGTRAVCPAEISAGEKTAIAATAEAVFRLLDCRGYARVDMRADRHGRINVIEVNPNPDISPGAGATRQAAAAGMTYTQFIGKIIEIALEKSDDHQYPSDAQERQTHANANTSEYTRVQTG